MWLLAVVILASMGAYTLDDILAARKSRDSWWTVFMVDPLACRLALLVANHTSITPNGLTRLSMAIGVGSAACFAQGMLATGAILFYASFMVDCMDGKVARLKRTGTPFGLWLDYVGDRIRVAFCAFGLAFGQFEESGELDFLLCAIGIVLLDLFRYINGPQLKRVREAMRNQLQLRSDRECVFMEDILKRNPRSSAGELVIEDGQRLIDLHKGFHSRFPWFDGFRLFLVRHRVRTHVMSGIEFHAAVFVVAPLFGIEAFVPITIVAGTVLLVFEITLVYRTWLATREMAEVVAEAVPEREKVLV
jgi:hypothetical protein